MAGKDIKGHRFRHLVQNFGDNSTIHGVAYLLGTTATNIADKVIWLIVVLLANAFGISLIYLLYRYFIFYSHIASASSLLLLES
jgi:hypothetical protein